MGIVAVLLIAILVVLILANVRVEVVLWTLVIAGIAGISYSAYYDPNAKKQVIALIVFLAILTGIYYGLKYLVKKLIRKIKRH